ncbi:MAG: hypothetical protein AAFU67_03050 [Bacteroidota bacterium]
MSEHPIDKHFREGLGQYRAPVSEDLWAGIAANQLKKRRAARLTRAGLLIAGLLTVSLIIWQIWPNNSEATTTPLEPTIPAVASRDINTTTTNHSSTEEVISATSPTNQSVTISKPPSLQQEDQSKPASANDNRSKAISTSNLVSSILNTADQATESSSLTSEAQQSAALYSSLDKANNTSGTSHQTATRAILTLPLPLLAPYEREAPYPLVSEVSPSFERSRKPFVEIDLLGGFAYAHQVLDTKSEETRPELNAREISEFPEVSYLAGLRASLRLSSRFSARTGLFYTQIRNQFEYEQDVMGSDPILIKSSNRIRLLEIPLMLGYELPGRRFRLAINAGTTVNLSTKANGRYLTPNQLEPIKLSENNIYRSNIGLGWVTSLTAAYDLGQGNSLLIEPTLKSYPGSFTLSDYGLKERYWVVGLQLGLRHQLK